MSPATGTLLVVGTGVAGVIGTQALAIESGTNISLTLRALISIVSVAVGASGVWFTMRAGIKSARTTAQRAIDKAEAVEAANKAEFTRIETANKEHLDAAIDSVNCRIDEHREDSIRSFKHVNRQLEDVQTSTDEMAIKMERVVTLLEIQEKDREARQRGGFHTRASDHR